LSPPILNEVYSSCMRLTMAPMVGPLTSDLPSHCKGKSLYVPLGGTHHE